MKIAWFSPFSQKNGISKYSKSILRELKNYCDVDLFVQKSETDLLDPPVPINFYSPYTNFDFLNNYDYIVYNFGNNAQYHTQMYKIYLDHPGIVIAHDFVMHHFFHNYFIEIVNKPDLYYDTLNYLYSQKASDLAKNYIEKGEALANKDLVMDYPLCEKIFDRAHGVIVHSDFFFNYIKDKTLSPLAKINHPHYYYDNVEDIEPIAKDPNKLYLIFIGNINYTKLIGEVLTVMGKNLNLAKKTQFILIGEIDKNYKKLLDKLIEKYNLKDCVQFMGFLSDEYTYSYLKAADACINLRYPNTEGASGSVIEELYFGKPVIVLNSGFYSELSDSCVLKINKSNIQEELVKYLELLLNDKDKILELSKNAKQFADQNFSLKNYIDSFLNFLNDAASMKPDLFIIDKIAQELSFMGYTKNDNIDFILSEIENLLLNQ